MGGAFLKRFISIIILLSIIFSLSVPALADETEISAHSAILVCADTGDVLYEKNPGERMHIASITKIMTAILVIEHCRDLDSEVKIKPECCNIEGSSMYLEAGKTYTVKELLLGMLLASGNDAAAALAGFVSGSTEKFARLMNDKARELGMTDSSFKNPHGLDEEGHYSTARDMACLMSYCMKNENFRELSACKAADIGDLTFVNHNKLLWNCEGCIGGKTGYTETAGRTLVSCAERGGMTLVCVTLGAPDDWNDHRTLYDLGFENYKETSFLHDDFSFAIPIISGAKSETSIVPENDICICSKVEDMVIARFELPRMLFAGAGEGEKAGVIKVFVNGRLAEKQNLVYTDNVTRDESLRLSIGERINRLIGRLLRPYYVEGEL